MNYLNTCTYHDKGDTVTRLYSTEIVRVNNTQIKLNTGGWNTVTTKRRMNQVSQDNALGFHVFQRNWQWFASYKGTNYAFDLNDKVTLQR